MMRRFRLPLTLTLMLGFGLACAGNRGGDQAADESPPSTMAPYHGLWRVDYETSYDFVLANQDTNDVRPGTYSDYISKFGTQIRMEISDSTIAYDRGRHHTVMPITVTAETETGVDLDADMNGQIYKFHLYIDEGGFLHMLSNRPNFQEMFLYERAPADWQPSMPPPPPGRPASGSK